MSPNFNFGTQKNLQMLTGSLTLEKWEIIEAKVECVRPLGFYELATNLQKCKLILDCHENVYVYDKYMVLGKHLQNAELFCWDWYHEFFFQQCVQILLFEKSILSLIPWTHCNGMSLLWNRIVQLVHTKTILNKILRVKLLSCKSCHKYS